MSATATDRPLFDSLRRLMRSRAPAPEPLERCELCGAGLAREHDHMLELDKRQLICACQACAVLFSDAHALKYRRVPRRVQRLDDFQITDAQWDGLLVPINLAFFYYSLPKKHVHCVYPSPAGPTESLLELDSWQELAAANPVLGQLEPDVEALLANRIGAVHEYYRISIDKCYELVGLIRIHWRGFSGGKKVWEEIALFFEKLKTQH